MAESMKDYETELEASFKKIEEGDILTGTVISVDEKEVVVDLKYYAEGIIPAEDYSREPGFSLKEQVNVGDEVSATVVRKDDGNGNILLSRVEAADVLAWDRLKELKDLKEVIDVVVKGIVNGGVIAYVEGIRGFIPASKLALNYVEDTNEYLNRRIQVQVIDVNKEDKKLILSAKEILREKAEEERKNMNELKQLEAQRDDEIEIDLRELFLALKKKIVWILLTAIVFAGASGLITKFAMTPIYSSTAQLYVVSKGGLSQLTDLTMGSQLTQDYMVIVKTRPVLEQVIADLKLDMDYKELEKKITVENPSDTRIMQITITDKDAALAQRITQDLAEVTAKTVAEKMDVKSPTIIEKAYKADKPDSPSLKKNVLIGAVLGFILMAAAIVIQYLMNDTILKEEDIEKYLGINTLAQLPLVKGTTKRTKKVKRARE